MNSEVNSFFIAHASLAVDSFVFARNDKQDAEQDRNITRTHLSTQHSH